jgi:hypothetical protein
MISPANRTILYSVGLVLIAIVVTIPDVILDISLSIFHSLFDFSLELVHILFEAIESALDHLIEHFFHTELRQTQIIVFYILILIGIILFYGLLKLWIPFYRHCKLRLKEFLSQEKTFISLYWLNSTLTDKIKMVAVILVISYIFILTSF